MNKFFKKFSFSALQALIMLFCTTDDGSFGKCVDLRSCKSLYKQYTQGSIEAKDIPICDSVRRLVCCPRISAKKCKEYGRHALEFARVGSLLIGQDVPEVVVRTKCTHIPASLVVGGEEAGLYEFPHQALLGYEKEKNVDWLCGGSLVSPDFVLTAAHCLYLPGYENVKYVKLGINDRSYDGDKVVLTTISQTYKHPRGEISSSHNDIALLKLQDTVKINEFILPICMPTRPYYNERGIVTGFGETGRGVLSQKLMKVVLERFDHQNCKGNFEGNYNEDTMLCYGHHKQRKDSCTGDSGGPLQVSNHDIVNCTYTQFGIVSIGPKFCGVPGAAGGYVNVYNYIDWIEGIVWKDEE